MPDRPTSRALVTAGEAHRHRLADGRSLCYQIFGDQRGYPVCYCHGFPGSRLEARMAEAAARATGIRLIAADRPGFGRSDFQPGRQMRDWVPVVAALMDALGHPRFGDLWYDSSKSAVLIVPSLLSPFEPNLLINRRHPQLAEVRVAGPLPAFLDQRLISAG